ncbi:MAG TPA: TonB-dependent receptor [Allosphingosinicella sp.]|uniref:TonB-dependent receptor plug domain-containing protein n=1 Tax=Allosphingosinicella sp. TaxID=2823234 RepID=UPI002ED915D5
MPKGMRASRCRKMWWLGSVAAVAVAAPAGAQETGDAPPPIPTLPAAVEGAKSYTPQDFVRFAPKNAYDMLQQVPGFIIVEGSEQRGLGQARANILINGERFSGKSNSVVTELQRIAAGDVVRIDIVDGATLNVPGLSGQVANIFINARKQVSGQFKWNPQARFKRLPPRMTNGQASISGSSGNLDWTLGFVNDSFVNGNAGPEYVTNGSGAEVDLRQERLDIFGEQPKISLGLKHRGSGGSVGNFNASYQIYHFDAEEISNRTYPFGVDHLRHFREGEREYNYELGGDYEFGLFGGRLKLIGLRRFEHSPYHQQIITSFSDGRANTGSRFEQKADETETILRGEYSWNMGGADWQLALEGAYNVLDVKSGLFNLDGSGVFQPVPLNNAVSTVDEKRGEAMLSYGRPLSPALTLQSAIGGEYSQLSQSGPHGLTRSFFRPKGFVSLAWKASPRLDVSAKIERKVGQLNFFDFVAFVNVGGGFGNAGNPEIVPQQSWEGQVEATRNFGEWGTATARLYGRLYQDVVDVIPIGETGQAPGNLDKASLYGFFWSSTLNLDPIGIKGAKIDVEMTLQDSRIEDQLTGRFRDINNITLRDIEINFRHDLPNSDWAYGGYYNEFEQAYGYRLDIQERPFNDPGGLGVFVEHKNLLGLTVRTSLDNLLGTQETFRRTFYDGRRTNPVLFSEYRDRDYGPILTFSISGEF